MRNGHPCTTSVTHLPPESGQTGPSTSWKATSRSHPWQLGTRVPGWGSVPQTPPKAPVPGYGSGLSSVLLGKGREKSLTLLCVKDSVLQTLCWTLRDLVDQHSCCGAHWPYSNDSISFQPSSNCPPPKYSYDPSPWIFPPGKSPIEALHSLKHSSEWLPTHAGGRGESDHLPQPSYPQMPLPWARAARAAWGQEVMVSPGQEMGRVQWSRNMRKRSAFH